MDRSLVGCCPYGHIELDTTEATEHMHALEREMATHSSILAWRIPGTGAAVYGVTQSQTQVKRLSSSSSIFSKLHNPVDGHLYMLSVFGIKLFLTLLVRFL